MPRLIRPQADAYVPYAVSFAWTGVAGAAAYAIQVAEEPEFRAPLLVDQEADEPFFEVDLPVAGPLWWRVRALDARGAPGPWSVVRKLEILPPPLATGVFAITLTPTSLPGGDPAEGLITLSGPAPAGGATVTLSSSDAANVKLPPRVLFAAGARTATFFAQTRPVSAGTAVRIFTFSRGDQRMVVLNINPPLPQARLTSFAVTPAILAAGSPASGKVILARPAPATTTVRLASEDASRVSVPEAVTIPAGASAANFAVRTAHDGASGTVQITASLEDTVRTATLNLRGAASNAALPAPAPAGPEEGAAVIHTGPIEFTWSALAGAVSYTIEVDDSADFAAPLVASRTVPAPRLSITPLPLGTMWWRVRANDANGAPGRWSTPRVLRVE